MAEFRINRKEVILRDSLTVKQASKLPRLLRESRDTEEYESQIPVLQMVVEPCELVPDPTDTAAFEGMTLSVFVPLANKVGEHINRMFVEAVDPN